MIKKYFTALLIIATFFTCLSACGSAESSSDNRDGKTLKQETIPPYTDMSEYKGIGGYVGYNNIYNYTDIFDIVYDWGDSVKMPFPKPEGISGEFYSESYVLCDVKEDWLETYTKQLKELGLKTVISDREFGKRDVLIYNEEFSAFIRETDNSLITGSETGLGTSRIDAFVFVFTGFVKDPILKADEVKKIIEDKELLKENEKFNNYYLIPIENESVRKAGYYECLIFTEEYYNQELTERFLYEPYYMIIKDGEVCLFEQAVYSPLIINSANLYEDNGITKLVLTTTYFRYETSGDVYRSGIFTYELKNEKFIKKDCQSAAMPLIAEISDGEIKLLRVTEAYVNSEMGNLSGYEGGHALQEGLRYKYKIVPENLLEREEALYNIEYYFNEGLFSNIN